MSSGARLAEERKRLGLNQAEFAALAGTDAPAQELYETDRRELRAGYLARLADADVDIVYVLTGRRSETWLSRGARDLLTSHLSLPPELQEALEAMARSLRDRSRQPGTTHSLHSRRGAYRGQRPH